jgi:transcriptional regulator with XRE-family HTH domain
VNTSKAVRKVRGLSQEAFSNVSCRTYMSTLERDVKSPIIHKLTELCEVMEVHPLTMLTLTARTPWYGEATSKTAHTMPAETTVGQA